MKKCSVQLEFEESGLFILSRAISATYKMQRFVYTDETLQNAVAVVLNANTSYRDVGNMFAIPKSTLYNSILLESRKSTLYKIVCMFLKISI